MEWEKEYSLWYLHLCYEYKNIIYLHDKQVVIQLEICQSNLHRGTDIINTAWHWTGFQALLLLYYWYCSFYRFSIVVFLDFRQYLTFTLYQRKMQPQASCFLGKIWSSLSLLWDCLGTEFWHFRFTAAMCITYIIVRFMNVHVHLLIFLTFVLASKHLRFDLKGFFHHIQINI